MLALWRVGAYYRGIPIICSWHALRVLLYNFFFFFMFRRPPRSTQSRSSAASDVYKRQPIYNPLFRCCRDQQDAGGCTEQEGKNVPISGIEAVSYTHLRAHETVLDLVCRLLLEKKKTFGPPGLRTARMTSAARFDHI